MVQGCYWSLMSSESFLNTPRKIRHTAIYLCYRVSPNLPLEVDPTPLLMLTILHQAFERYAQRLATSQREEWAKGAGRFEDVSFVEPTEQVIRLIGSAIERTAAVEKPNLSVAIDLELKPRQLDTNEFMSLLENCLPLHPTVALIV